ncbi:hypothetical protein QBC41DRAFT_124147 [Cercophora samala]|uniref:Secreted protein n=1 Tax=Cercophora samala TaxID=330535 RepID=A0AA39ZC82_9PEZI|nr:hypothetical protein QBC41DRAFT_124147 [Cercophora samala]
MQHIPHLTPVFLCLPGCICLPICCLLPRLSLSPPHENRTILRYHSRFNSLVVHLPHSPPPPLLRPLQITTGQGVACSGGQGTSTTT